MRSPGAFDAGTFPSVYEDAALLARERHFPLPGLIFRVSSLRANPGTYAGAAGVLSNSTSSIMRPLPISPLLATLALFLLGGCGGTPTTDGKPIAGDQGKPTDDERKGTRDKVAGDGKKDEAPSTKEQVKVAFVSNNPASFWTIAEAGARKAGEEFNAEVLFKRPAQGDAAQQKEVIDALLNQGIGAISISVIDPKNQTPYLDEIAAKVPLLAVDNDAPKSKRLAYLGTSNYLAGRAVGKLIKEALPDGGTLAIFVGDRAPLNARQRRQGVLDELAGKAVPKNQENFLDADDGKTYGKFKLHRTYTDQPEGEQKAKENAVNALTELQGESNLCFVGLWAYNPPAILSAVKDKGQAGKVKIIGFDEDFATLGGIADDHIYATVVQQPYQFGYQSVRLMATLARGQKPNIPAGGKIYIPYRIIMKSAGEAKNGEPKREAVAEFRTELQQLLGGK
jgi:ribose transport system substrate-binding protein